MSLVFVYFAIVIISYPYVSTEYINDTLNFYGSYPDMPFEVSYSILGYDHAHDKLWSIGGHFSNGPHEYVYSYSFASNTWSENAIFHITLPVTVHSQSYCQIGNVLYWYSAPYSWSKPCIHSFNMTIGDVSGYNSNYSLIPYLIDDPPCLTTDGTNIYLISSSWSVHGFYILNTVSGEWCRGPDMTQAHPDSTCQFFDNKIFIFGPWNIEYTESVLVVNNSNLTIWTEWSTGEIQGAEYLNSNSWHYRKSVVFNESIIYILGGLNFHNVTNNVYMFDPFSLKLIIPQKTFHNTTYGRLFGSAVIAKKRIFFVGGLTASGVASDKWYLLYLILFKNGF